LKFPLSNFTFPLLEQPAVGFIDWIDGFIDMQAHVLNVFATAVSNDNIPIAGLDSS
jgi:hypothetical protein